MATYRLDSANGRRVKLLQLTADGYAHVATLGSPTMPGIAFETLASRLYRVLKPIIHKLKP
jgi:hypothetical protein